jgi:hypothetical protein
VSGSTPFAAGCWIASARPSTTSMALEGDLRAIEALARTWEGPAPGRPRFRGAREERRPPWKQRRRPWQPMRIEGEPPADRQERRRTSEPYDRGAPRRRRTRDR